MAEQKKRLWWQDGIIYQIYPRSFQDSNGNGSGDIQGIIQRLDYLSELGITAIWISPMYPSPMADFGYDIANYTDVDPLFGDMADFDELLRNVHKRGIKLILDFVPNHTSDEHPWFIESRSSKDNPKRDWYIWKDPREDGSAPNNWLSVFGGIGWEWDENTQQFYYHAFHTKQPDLNWRNEEVQKAMLDAMRFWLDKGVDGFRVDVMWHMIKDSHFRDNPMNPVYQPNMSTYDSLLPVYSTDQPEVHDIVHKMRALLDEYGERMMIGEIYLPIHKLVSYYGADNNGAHLPFNFQLLSLPWNARMIAATVDEYEGSLPTGGWPNWVLGNHDQPRITGRIGKPQAKIAAMMLLTLRGTPTIYYGDEIGMTDVPIPLEEVKDPQGLNMPDKYLSRDPGRTPMQWDAGLNASFTTGAPWLRVARNHMRVNVVTEKANPLSMYNLYRRLIELRQKEPALMYGNYTPVYSDDHIMAYIRELEDKSSRFLIMLNLSHRPCYFKADHIPVKGTIVLSTSPEIEGTDVDTSINLYGDEGLIIRLA